MELIKQLTGFKREIDELRKKLNEVDHTAVTESISFSKSYNGRPLFLTYDDLKKDYDRIQEENENLAKQKSFFEEKLKLAMEALTKKASEYDSLKRPTGKENSLREESDGQNKKVE
jgi:cell division septum initiation protein DivIVA